MLAPPPRSDSYSSGTTASSASSAQPPTPEDSPFELPFGKIGSGLAFARLPGMPDEEGEEDSDDGDEVLEQQSDSDGEEEDDEDEEMADANQAGPSKPSGAADAGASSKARKAAAKPSTDGSPTETAVRGLTRRGRPRKLFRYLQDLGGISLAEIKPQPRETSRDATVASPPKRKWSKGEADMAPPGECIATRQAAHRSSDAGTSAGASALEDESGKRKRVKKVSIVSVSPRALLAYRLRSKVAKACLFCKRSHMTCDEERPCRRCVKRGIPHMCADEEPAGVTASASSSTVTPDAAAPAASKKGKPRSHSAASVRPEKSLSPPTAAVASSSALPASPKKTIKAARRATMNGGEESTPRVDPGPSIPARTSSHAARLLRVPGFDSVTSSPSSSTIALPRSLGHASAVTGHTFSVPGLAGDDSHHDAGPLLNLGQLSPGGDLHIPAGELFWASFPGGSGVTPGHSLMGGLTPFETFLKEANAQGAAGQNEGRQPGHADETSAYHQQPLLTPVGCFRLADGTLQPIAPALHAAADAAEMGRAGDSLHSFSDGLLPQQPVAFNLKLPGKQPMASGLPMQEALAPLPWENTEYERLKGWLERGTLSSSWTPSHRSRMLAAVEGLRSVIQPRTMGLDEAERRRQDFDFARVYAHYKHAVLESVSAPMLLVKRWGDICGAFPPSRAGSLVQRSADHITQMQTHICSTCSSSTPRSCIPTEPASRMSSAPTWRRMCTR
jgi:hypothetical protein